MDALKECDVVSVRRIDNVGKLRAFVDIRIAGSLIIRGCFVFQGKNGMFAQMPRQVNRDGKWHSIVVPADDELNKHYKEKILEAYQTEAQK